MKEPGSSLSDCMEESKELSQEETLLYEPGTQSHPKKDLNIKRDNQIAFKT
jgi:hypothetical protein